MSIRKTYGVRGLVEWNTWIKAGKGTLHLTFSGGALTAYGTTPATYSTKNPLYQAIIENSDYFKEGRIELISEQRTGESEQRTEESEQGGANRRERTANSGERTANSGERTGGSEQGAAESGQMKAVEVSCLDDAKEYLRENFGVRNIRTRAEAQKAGEERGVTFVGM